MRRKRREPEPQPKQICCAIYTRKSTEEGLQQDFNSLDAQANGQGPDGDFSITSFTRSEELEEALTVSVTAKLAVFRSWVEGT